MAGGGGLGISLAGDWARALAIIARAPGRIRQALDRAVMREAQYLRGKIVSGIASGAPGGKAYAPLAPLTLAIRAASGFGGSKPMVRTGTFRNSVVAVRVGEGVFVGIKRGTPAANGKDMVNLAELHENGKTFTYRMTDKQRRFLFAMLRKGGGGGGGSSGGGGNVTVRIPARPTFGPVFEAEAKPDAVRDRFWRALAADLGGDFGTP